MKQTNLKLLISGVLLGSIVLTGCNAAAVETESSGVFGQESAADTSGQIPEAAWTEDTIQFDYQVNPEEFTLLLQVGGEESDVIRASNGIGKRQVADYQEQGDQISWNYPKEQMEVLVKPEEDYLSVTLTAAGTGDQSFTWPHISADEYYLPLGEGKRIPANDPVWQNHLNGQHVSAMEQLSMPFWASTAGEYAVLYIMEDPFRTQLEFQADSGLPFAVHHDYPAIDENRDQRFRIYVTDNDPVSIAKVYRSYAAQSGSLVTLEQKAADNPDIRKLYGAPFIYLWGDFIISAEDINWQAFIQAVDTPVMKYLESLTDSQENGVDFKTVLSELRNQDYVSVYQKNVVCSYLSNLLKSDGFRDPAVFTADSSDVEEFLARGYDNLNESEKVQLNKYSLAAELPQVFHPVSDWMKSNTTDLISDLKTSGLEQAWIGLNGVGQAYAKPELVAIAAKQGYLIGSYDSYHSIHEPGKEQWETAAFTDPSLYEQATVMNKEGEKEAGFQNVGRKLNPVLSMPAVKERMQTIMEHQLLFNSWFIDCDATGEIYDDYTPEHITTQSQDLAARLKRMAYIRDTYDMVIGSEGGHDFAASTIAFAHGIELMSFSWMDDDMKKNQDSPYYIGKYYNPNGGVAEHFAKRIPIKDEYYTLFVDPAYDVPLYKLVYNDCVITGYHWDWSTFKIQDATTTRMLREVLYNVPPLYHLDADTWTAYKDDIIRHNTVWSDFAKKAVTREMTGFTYVTEDGLVQKTEYGQDLWAVANFGAEDFEYEGQVIPAKSVWICAEDDQTIYTPEVLPEHQ